MKPGGRSVLLLRVVTAVLFLAGLVAVPVVDARQRDGATAAVDLPGGPAASQLRWVISLFGKGASESELREHFEPSFLEAVPAEQVNAILVEIGSDGPFEISAAESQGPYGLAAVLEGPSTRMNVNLAVEAAPPHRITGLLFKPAENRDPYANFDELVAGLRRAAPEVGFLAADVSDGECRPVHAVEPDKSLALGSAFKLYVLGAVAEAVLFENLQPDQPGIRWDQTLTIRDDQLVHTSQRFGAQANQREASVQDLAQAMIEVSDNTATDTLLEVVGRRHVEATQGRMGMKEPGANVPFLSTREMTLLKWGKPPAADEYLAQRDAEARRQFLDQRLAGQPAREQDLAFTPGPNRVDTIEWFASAADLCRAHVALAALGGQPGLEPLREILGANPGIPFDRRAEHVSFKGGSEPGVVAGSWLIEGPDDQRHVIVILLRNTAGPIETSVLTAAADAYRLLVDRPA